MSLSARPLPTVKFYDVKTLLAVRASSREELSESEPEASESEDESRNDEHDEPQSLSRAIASERFDVEDGDIEVNLAAEALRSVLADSPPSKDLQVEYEEEGSEAGDEGGSFEVLNWR
ncbi:hypothetical protein EW026_g6476 [Hermanssonia centrifuga]|uniref:Uncharacterized protein n=1 Tax=Hermanssonia centrifuga TaxID=98765 RepID=A0A4S4KBX0_9APHY|nr:hypothetical protein EW026_g6476 [Hermanssonia centrifuga]